MISVGIRKKNSRYVCGGQISSYLLRFFFIVLGFDQMVGIEVLGGFYCVVYFEEFGLVGCGVGQQGFQVFVVFQFDDVQGYVVQVEQFGDVIVEVYFVVVGGDVLCQVDFFWLQGQYVGFVGLGVEGFQCLDFVQVFEVDVYVFVVDCFDCGVEQVVLVDEVGDEMIVWEVVDGFWGVQLFYLVLVYYCDVV